MRPDVDLATHLTAYPLVTRAFITATASNINRRANAHGGHIAKCPGRSVDILPAFGVLLNLFFSDVLPAFGVLLNLFFSESCV